LNRNNNNVGCLCISCSTHITFWLVC